MVFLNKLSRHDKWRKLAKKSRRKRIRQAKAKERDLKLLEEQEILEKSPRYQKWIEEQELIQEENRQEELRQATLREEQWWKIEEEAQKQWQELQKKIANAREEKMKQNMRIKLEWEKEQKQLRALKEAKEKQEEEKRLLREKHEKELLDFLEQGGDTPEHLKTTMETNPGKQICPFFHKVSACRFFDTCSRNHVRPGISRTLLFTNFFSDISLETRENEHGSDSNLEFEKEETYEHYKDFFYDVILELEKCGKIRNFRTCCNHEGHLRGNVYVEYENTRDALVTYHRFNGRWYGGKQLNVEFCTIENWKTAICGLFHRNRCPKGNSCNFLHVFKNPRNLYSNDESRSHDSRLSRDRSERSSRRKEDYDEDGWGKSSLDKRNWRWSESPEKYSGKEIDNGTRNHKDNERRLSTKDNRKRYGHNDETDRRSRKRRRSRSKSRSLSPSESKQKSKHSRKHKTKSNKK